MKKKIAKKKKPAKQKIDVVLESLLNLEQKMKELIDKVESLQRQLYYHPKNSEPKQYWPNAKLPNKYYDGVTWYNTKWNPPEYN